MASDTSGRKRACAAPWVVRWKWARRIAIAILLRLSQHWTITLRSLTAQIDAVQRAGVYSESKNAPAGPPTGTGPGTPAEPAAAPATPTTGSIIETSYKTDAGLSENVRVLVSTSQGTTGKWLLQIERTPNVILAMATTFLSGSQVKSRAVQESIHGSGCGLLA